MFNNKNMNMETMKLRAAFCIGLLALIATGCKQETLNKPTVTNNNLPGVVTNVQVQNQNGRPV
jgi:cytochrome oxidase Cu insertion factor (SCO1/SenC/PrrC family)